MTRALCRLPAVLACAAVALAQTTPEQLDIEPGELGKTPPGWFVPTPGYRAELSADNPKAGERCARLAGPASNTALPFGNLMCALDATPYRGKLVRFRAAVRVRGETPDDLALLWLRVDRPDGQRGFFDNMSDRPIRTAEWRDYEIIGDIAPDAATINLGLVLRTRGEAWLDDVRLEVVGQISPPGPLYAPRGLENLIAFTHLLGYVRHFHPSDEAQQADWEAFTIAAVPEVEVAAEAAQLAAVLDRLFRPIAPTVRVFPTGQTPELPCELHPPADRTNVRVIAWEHHGFGQGHPKPLYHSERTEAALQRGLLDRLWGKRSPQDLPDPAQPFQVHLGAGVSCLVPLALYMDADGTLPHTTATASAPSDAARPLAAYAHIGNDRTTRIADVMLAWNVLQHFYPYFDVVQTDWNAALATALGAAATDDDERAFLDTLRRLVAALHDGHGRVTHASDQARALPPFAWDWVEEQLVITAVDQPPSSQPATAPELCPGDTVVALDDRPVAELLKAAEALISGATPQWRRWRAVTELAWGQPGQPLKLTIRRGTECATSDDRGAAAAAGEAMQREFSVTVQRKLRDQPVVDPRPEKITEVRPGIFYLDGERATDEDFRKALPQLEKARGIIFDFRGYPSKLHPRATAFSAVLRFGPGDRAKSPATVAQERGSPVATTRLSGFRSENAVALKLHPDTYLPHLTRQLMTSAQWQIPVVRRPDRQDLTFHQDPEWRLKPREPYLTARRAFLIDARAISYAESCLGIVEHYKLGELVGGPTAGTNGNVNPFTLPGGYTVTWTGMKVLKQDGAQHHGVGVLPTIPVRRTVAGVRAGRDEILERAIEVVSHP
jgi:C-terminal processing protease CtpA/Prc